jgi:tetratricopeptide (TPR) repeat protein
VKAAAAALACTLLAAAAPAAEDARTQAEQRIALVARLVADSPAAQRIVASGQSAAVSHLDESRLHLARAQDAFKANDYALARRAADEALMHLGHARRMVPDAPARQQMQRQRHEQQQAALERLLEAWRARAAARSDNGNADLLDAAGLIGNARSLGQNGRHDEALQQLAAAQERLVRGMARTYAGAGDIDYTPRAATPGEAFHLELAQYGAMADLLPVAMAQMRPRPDALALIERYRQSANALHTQAQQSFERGDSANALANLRNAVLYLQRALAAAGVVTPLPADEKP